MKPKISNCPTVFISSLQRSPTRCKRYAGTTLIQSIPVLVLLVASSVGLPAYSQQEVNNVNKIFNWTSPANAWLHMRRIRKRKAGFRNDPASKLKP